MRWKPNRAGIFNIWEYDDQTFEFGDGRLVLRGRNGSGKSNALAALFPFLFDGVMSAARMDPMGGARSMKSLLLGREDDDPNGRYRHNSGTGYVWLELVRPDGTADEFVTIGVGAAATQQRDADAWFFVTGRRVGHDLDLADGDVPLSRRQLTERLAEPAEGQFGTPGRVMTTAEEFRTAVDQHLFGLGAVRYRTLVDLLLTLRRPHLAGKLDTEHLSATLSAGLAELDPALIDDVAHSFDDLDAMQHELDGLAASLDAVERFLPPYREHLTGTARARATAVTEAHRDRRKVSDVRSTAARERDEQAAQKKAHEQATNELDRELSRLNAAIDVIQQSAAYRNAAALDEVKRSAGQAEWDAANADKLAATSKADAEEAATDAEAAAATHAQSTEHVAAAVAEWTATARTVTIEARFDDGFDHDQASAAVTARQDDVRQVRELAEIAVAAVREAERAEADETQRRTELEDATAELAGVSQVVDAEADALSRRRSRWAHQVNQVVTRLGDAVGEQLAGLDEKQPTHSGTGTDADDPEASARLAHKATTAFWQATDRHLADLAVTAQRWCDQATAAVEAQREQIDGLSEERRQVAEEPNPGPPPNATRPDASRAERPGAPLYVCVDFAAHVDKAERAGFEAALAAAGLLDARIGADDSDEDVLDARLTASGGEPMVGTVTLADVLVPVATTGVDDATITAALRSVPLADPFVALGEDGRWRLGPLVGRFTQPEQRYIGHEARERRRAARLTELDERLTHERRTLEDRTGRRDQLESLRRQLGAERDDQPAVDPLLEALDNKGRAGATVVSRGDEVDRAARHAADQRQHGETTASDLHRAAVAQRLPSDLDALAEVSHALRECQRWAGIIKERQGWLATTGKASAKATARAEQAAEAAAARVDEAAKQHTRAQVENDRYELLRTNVGDDAEKAVRQLTETRARRDDTSQRRDDHAGELSATDKQIATLTERISQLDDQHAAAQGRADAADRHFEVVCSAQVAEVLALPGVEPEAEPAVAARRVLEGTTPVTEDATNRMEKAHREVLLDGLRAGYDPSMPKVDGVDVVRVATADGEVPIGALARQLRDQHERTSQLLSKHEREVFETHLLTRAGDALRQLLLEADGFEHRINAEMAKVPTASGMTVELRWEIVDDERGLRRAVDTLRSAPDMLGPDQREQLREFFMHRIADLRANDPGLSFAETLTHALDYRSWHQFALFARFADGKRQRVTRTFYRGLSGGEAATVLHLPLFAAAAAQYSAGTVGGPRLIALDEAFAGIDDQMRNRLMGLLTQLDLDVILTSHEFWGFYGSVPSLVLYDLIRRPPTPGVYAQRFDWMADEAEPAAP